MKMTNGEMIQKIFTCEEVCEPIIEDDIIHVVFADKKDSAIGFDWSWWNAEYKEKATNGEVIKAMFPNRKLSVFADGHGHKRISVKFTETEWNAPYKAEGEDMES